MSTQYDYETFQEQPSLPPSAAKVSEVFTAVMMRVYGWMALGLLLTTAVALVTVTTPAILFFVLSSPFVFWGFVIGELILVVAIGRSLNKLSPSVAKTLFFVYAAVNGVTLSVIFLAYGLGTIVLAFGTTTLLFLILTVVGLTTREDLTKWGPLLFVALIGLILASLANLLLASTALDWIITYAGILIFLGLIVYDSNRLKKLTYASVAAGQAGDQLVGTLGVMGALHLYLDFINLFLFILRLLGRRR